MFRSPVEKAYWWKDASNFGDGLAPLLLERFAGLKVEWNTISNSKIVSIGSILEHIPPLWDGIVLGSGRLIEDSRLHLQRLDGSLTADIIAVRGPLTAREIPGNFALGDPGILSDELVGGFQKFEDKEWDLGIVPHFSDNELIPKFKALIPKEYTVHEIYPSYDPLQVIREIGLCRRIVTSSLHGMIVADSFGTPRRVEYTPNMDRDGKDFKFRDYSASIHTPFTFGMMTSPYRAKIDDIKFSIYDAYRSVKGLLRSRS